MLPVRVIPILLLDGSRLVKTTRFKKPVYVGDPRNAVKIFNDKEVDELVLLDISASGGAHPPQRDLIGEIASECFMPLCYGGGVTDLDQIRSVIDTGVEKVSINTKAMKAPDFLKRAADRFGISTIVASMDVRKTLFSGYEVVVEGGRLATGRDPRSMAEELQQSGAGEILLNAVDRDGTMRGYDVTLIRTVSEAVDIPVIACGGAGSLQDLSDAVVRGGASAVAAGSMFVFHGKHRAVLISYPSQEELAQCLIAQASAFQEDIHKGQEETEC